MHFAWLSAAGTTTFIQLWGHLPRLRHVPTPLALLIVIQLPKPDGGKKPIRLFPCALRPVARWTRGTVGSMWLSHQKRGFFFGEKRKNCEICVWTQSTTAEYGHELGHTVISVLPGMRKAYEHLKWRVLWRKWQRHGFPLELLALLLELYAMPRVVMLKRAVSHAVNPLQAVVAGCSFADVMMRLHFLAILDDCHATWPSASLANVVDDIQYQASPMGPSSSCVVISRKMAWHSTLTSSLSQPTMRRLLPTWSAGIDAWTRRSSNPPATWGVDYAGGKLPGTATRTARVQKVHKSYLKVRVLKRLRGKVRPLVTQGLAPGGTWGLGATGVSWIQITRLRASAHANLFAHTGGRSHTIDLALSANRTETIDPAAKCTVNPIHMLHCALWGAWVPQAGSIACRSQRTTCLRAQYGLGDRCRERSPQQWRVATALAGTSLRASLTPSERGNFRNR